MGNLAVAPRSNVTQQVHYFRATVNYNTLNIDTTAKVPLGTLPANAIVTGVLIKIVTAFNAATTNVLTVGTSADAAALVAGADLDETVAGTTISFSQVGYMPTADTALFIKYTQTGTAASAGQAVVIVSFVPDNDR